MLDFEKFGNKKLKEAKTFNIRAPLIVKLHTAPFLATTSRESSAYAISWIKQFLPPKDKISVLDCGCGTGFFLKYLAAHFDSLYGLDLSIESLKWVSTVAPPLKGKVVAGDASAMPFADQSFDLIIIRATLHHIPDLDNTMRELRRTLKIGGLVFINEPASHNPIVLLLARLMSREKFFAPSELLGLFKEGFDLIAERRHSYIGFILRHVLSLRLWSRLYRPAWLWSVIAKVFIRIDIILSFVPVLNRCNLGVSYIFQRTK